MTTETTTKSRARAEVLAIEETEGRIVFRHGSGRLTVKASVVALRPVAGGFDLVVKSDRSVPYAFVPEALAAGLEAMGVEMLDASGASTASKGWRRGAFRIRQKEAVVWACGSVRGCFAIFHDEECSKVSERYSLTEIRTGLSVSRHKTAKAARIAAHDAEMNPELMARIALAVAKNALPEDEAEPLSPFVSEVETVAPAVERMATEDAMEVMVRSIEVAEVAEVLLDVQGSASVLGRLCRWIVGPAGPAARDGAMMGRGFRWSEDAGAWYRPFGVIDFPAVEVREVRAALPVAAMVVEVEAPAEADPESAGEPRALRGVESDIPLASAVAAHSGTSHSPERRGEQEREAYAATLRADYEALLRIATTPAKLAALDAEFPRYRQGYRSRFLSHLAARSRCLSTMIAGPSGFNSRRAEKRNSTEHKRMGEMIEFRKRALEAIRKELQPELAPIMAGDSDAVERLRAKIATAEEVQRRMKEANAAIRKHAKAGEAAQVAALVALGFKERRARDLLQPDFCNRIGFADFETRNNGANIRRMKERLAEISAAKSAPEPEPVKGENATLEDSPADNRVRLYFRGKPSAEVRSALKSAGFRWAPSLGCWQAYRNHRTIAAAQGFAA